MSDRFERAWETLTASVSELHADTTVRIKQRSDAENVFAVVSQRADTATGRLEIGEVIGEGGSGVVRNARQVLLDRDVAVKSLKADAPRKGPGQALLTEAMITGALEHPNIIPIYDLIADSDGRPIIVMKRIGGTPWKELIDTPQLITAMFGVEDHLFWHLHVLKSVCYAIAFAHSKGLLHRDLKPENVMIGKFNEVYVLDWGCAVGLRSSLHGKVMLASEIRVTEGTPSCMAPEMAEGAGERINETTDVYLLGALLHQVLTGQARHQGATIRDVLKAAYDSEPVAYESHIAPELADLCNRATARDQSRRPQTVGKFEAALNDFIEHRESIALCDEATRQLEALRRLLANAKDADGPSREALYGQLSVCRFGFTQALRSWADNALATAQLAQTISLMIAYEVGRRDGDAAALLLAQLPVPDPDLAARVARVRQEIAAETASLHRLRHDHDIRQGSRPRAYWVLFVAAFTSGWPLVAAQITDLPSIDQIPRGAFWAVPTIYVALGLILVKIAPRLFVTRVNRALLSMVVALGVVSQMIRVCGVMMAIPIGKIMILEKLLFAFAAAAVAIMANQPRIYLTALVFVIGAVVAMVIPHLALEVFALTNMLAIGWVGVIWLQLAESSEPTAL